MTTRSQTIHPKVNEYKNKKYEIQSYELSITINVSFFTEALVTEEVASDLAHTSPYLNIDYPAK